MAETRKANQCSAYTARSFKEHRRTGTCYYCKPRTDQTAQGEGGGAWKCWTCDYSTFFQVRRICRTQGHDVRRVEGKANV